MKPEFKINKKYDSGLASHYECNGLIFQWNAWVLCEIGFECGNVPHYCIASSFRSFKGRGGKLDLSIVLMNPTYDNCHYEDNWSTLSHFVPISIIEVPELSIKVSCGNGI